MTTPYNAKIAQLITGSLRHEASVTLHPYNANPFPLDLAGTDLSITYDEAWSPYIQASLGCIIPPTAFLDQIDPRNLTRLTIAAGYGYPDGSTELHQIADLSLRRREIRRPSNTLGLTAESDESFAQDHIKVTEQPFIPTTGINEAAAWMLDFAFIPQGYTLSSQYANGSFAPELAELEAPAGSNAWSVIDDIATRTEQRIFCDEDRVWRIRSRPVLAGTAKHSLEVGVNGTIVTSATALTRNDWANNVALEYRWRDAAGTDQKIVGTASVTSGPYATGIVGRKTYYRRIDKRISQATANKAAAAKLRNLVTRGRSLTLSAIAAYWLRPGDTISVKLPTGEAELHLIQSLTFRPLTGLMDITTRQPTDVTISTGE